jgi:hypothetical protein
MSLSLVGGVIYNYFDMTTQHLLTFLTSRLR